MTDEQAMHVERNAFSLLIEAGALYRSRESDRLAVMCCRILKGNRRQRRRLWLPMTLGTQWSTMGTIEEASRRPDLFGGSIYPYYDDYSWINGYVVSPIRQPQSGVFLFFSSLKRG